MNRSPEQIRVEVANHEAAHAAAYFLQGRRIHSVRISTHDEAAALKVGETAGHVRLPERPITNLQDAQEEVVALLAAEAAVRVLLASRILTAADIGATVEPPPDFALEDLVMATNGTTPQESSAHYGWYAVRDHPDALEAEEIVNKWTSGPLEAATLMAYLKARTSALVQSPRFQAVTSMIADALLEQNELSGEFAQELMERANTLFEINHEETTDDEGRK